MNPAELHQKLIAAAKAQAPDDRVPFAFERRVMARIKSASPQDLWALWGPGLWRSAASCVALTFVLSAWCWFSPGSSNAGDWSQDLENTLLAVADQDASGEAIR